VLIFICSALLDRLDDGSVSMASALHALAVDTRGTSSSEAALTSLFATIKVDVFEVESVDVAWDISAD
jgi:hypothetical protein